MRAGVILAGGRSTRFGEGDKAVADLAGVPVVRRVADRLVPAVDSLVVNCRADQVAALRDALDGYPLPLTFAEDPQPDQGPMAGIRTGLGAVESEYAFVTACDMPFVEPALVDHLFERARGHDAALPQLEDRWFQTTYAVYRADAMRAACERALDRGDRKILAAVEQLDSVVLGESEVREYADLDTFDNLNTPEEFRAAVERLDS